MIKVKEVSKYISPSCYTSSVCYIQSNCSVMKIKGNTKDGPELSWRVFNIVTPLAMGRTDLRVLPLTGTWTPVAVYLHIT